MRLNKNYLVPGAVLLCAFLLSGCAGRYMVISEVNQPLKEMPSYCIGEVEYALPLDIKEKDRPPESFVMILRRSIADQLDDSGIFHVMSVSSNRCDYEVLGSLIEYNKGSKFLQYLVGFGAGKAKLTANLKLVKLSSGETVFSANFTRAVSKYNEENESMFIEMAGDFVQVLRSQLATL